MKKCSKCGNPQEKSGYCKKCRNEYNKSRYDPELNRKKYLNAVLYGDRTERDRKYREDNKERITAYQKEYRDKKRKERENNKTD